MGSSFSISSDLLHRAAAQMGRLIRTIFLCDYLAQMPFRREIHRLIDHGESVHTLQRAIYYGQVLDLPVRIIIDFRAPTENIGHVIEYKYFPLSDLSGLNLFLIPFPEALR